MNTEINNAVNAADTDVQYDEKAKDCWAIKLY